MCENIKIFHNYFCRDFLFILRFVYLIVWKFDDKKFKTKYILLLFVVINYNNIISKYELHLMKSINYDDEGCNTILWINKDVLEISYLSKKYHSLWIKSEDGSLVCKVFEIENQIYLINFI